jgi:hypothetical protein
MIQYKRIKGGFILDFGNANFEILELQAAQQFQNFKITYSFNNGYMRHIMILFYVMFVTISVR